MDRPRDVPIMLIMLRSTVKAIFESKRAEKGIMKCNDKYFDKI